MKQHEQVIKIMKANGGFATLGFLNNNVDVSKWKTKTPYASIRRIVQDNRFFFKIKPGLWALNELKKTILSQFKIQETNSISEKELFNHTYFQGLLLELGKIKGFKTYIPPQDKNKKFLNKSLAEIADIDKIFEFSYNKILKRAKTVDVIWFNERNMPSSFFEVEHSTDIQNSLLKFDDLQDFYSDFYIVSSINRKKEYLDKISRNAFKKIRDRIKFVDYEYISNLHTKSMELHNLKDIL
ncbi:MAG: hypothetical protein DRJ01_13330 [Bacteroidetes bacterium]|nr:MAG: hypothetical protein DRJ01_13330 [Bacteroidota bacterium]